MCRFATDGPLDVEAFRARLRKMTDAQLLRYGKAARYMCSPDAYFGEAPVSYTHLFDRTDACTIRLEVSRSVRQRT